MRLRKTIHARAGQTVFISREDAAHVTIKISRVEGRADEFSDALWRASMNRLRGSKKSKQGQKLLPFLADSA